MNQPDSSTPKTAALHKPDSLDRVVMFVDMLGFAALTEENPVDVRMLDIQSGAFLGNVEEIILGPKNPLTEAFSHFHRALKWQIMTAQMSHALTAITFSDSAFIATAYLHQTTTFASELVKSLLWQKVPVRIGIAFGSFAAVRFRSEISMDGGDHASQFLGTAVVRSYQTEKCGIKGVRILLHPSVEGLLEDRTHNPVEPRFGGLLIRSLECPDSERANKASVSREIDYWAGSVLIKEINAWQGLQDMWAVAPDSAREHYQATAEAINRMRISRGEAPLTNLRRRTLPRSPKL